MVSLSDGTLISFLVILVFISGFFSGSETGVMSINRYRLRHLARAGHRSAKKISKLLTRPDRLLGVILIGNTFANVLASSIATFLFVRWLGDLGLVLSPIILTLFLLIFAEITPKTLAALYPQHVAFSAAWPLSFILKILYPIVWLSNMIANGVLRLFGIKVVKKSIDRLSSEELRTVVLESRGRISEVHQDMLLRILDFQNITVDDVMIPRNDVVGIDLDENWDSILETITTSQFTRLPLYEDDVDSVRGIVHIKDAIRLLAKNELTKKSLREIAREIYFIPEGTSLHVQLLNFRKEKRRLAMVVDEYGDVQGLVTSEDIVEEIVGELATDVPTVSTQIQPLADASHVVDGSANIREINRLMEWQLPTDGPKTLSGLIIEYLELIPDAPTCIILDGYPIEVLEVKDNMVKSVKVFPTSKVNESSD